MQYLPLVTHKTTCVLFFYFNIFYKPGKFFFFQHFFKPEKFFPASVLDKQLPASSVLPEQLELKLAEIPIRQRCLERQQRRQRLPPCSGKKIKNINDNQNLISITSIASNYYFQLVSSKYLTQYLNVGVIRKVGIPSTETSIIRYSIAINRENTS